MGFRIAKHEASLLQSLDVAVATRARLAANPITAPMVAPWDAWIADWKATFLQEIDHRIAVTTADAVAGSADDDLDDLSDELWPIVQDDPAERAFYYGALTNAQFTRPRLGRQYIKQGAWITHMATSSDPRVVDIGKRLADKHDTATKAIKTAQDADAAAREFRLTGARRQLIDRFNALGKGTEGELKELPHKKPELRLPKDFSERFLSSTKAVVPATIDELTKRRDALRDDYEAAKAALEAALAAEEADKAEAARAEREAIQQELAAAQAARQEHEKKIAELEAKLAKG